MLVAGHDLKFWKPIQDHLEATGLFEFRTNFWSSHNETDETEADALGEWADIIFCEWAQGNAVFFSKRYQAQKPIFVRFHLQEINQPYLEDFDFESISKVIFVSSALAERAKRKFNIPAAKVIVIPNAIPFEKYQKPKLSGSEKRLGLIGINPFRKRLDWAFDLLERLNEDWEDFSPCKVHDAMGHWVGLGTNRNEEV